MRSRRKTYSLQKQITSLGDNTTTKLTSFSQVLSQLQSPDLDLNLLRRRIQTLVQTPSYALASDFASFLACLVYAVKRQRIDWVQLLLEAENSWFKQPNKTVKASQLDEKELTFSSVQKLLKWIRSHSKEIVKSKGTQERLTYGIVKMLRSMKTVIDLRSFLRRLFPILQELQLYNLVHDIFKYIDDLDERLRYRRTNERDDTEVEDMLYTAISIWIQQFPTVEDHKSYLQFLQKQQYNRIGRFLVPRFLQQWIKQSNRDAIDLWLNIFHDQLPNWFILLKQSLRGSLQKETTRELTKEFLQRLQKAYERQHTFDSPKQKAFCTALEPSANTFAGPLRYDRTIIQFPFAYLDQEPFTPAELNQLHILAPATKLYDLVQIDTLEKTNFKLGIDDFLEGTKGPVYNIDINWLYKSTEYISNLSYRRRKILYAYTGSAYEIANAYLRGEIDEEMIRYEFEYPISSLLSRHSQMFTKKYFVWYFSLKQVFQDTLQESLRARSNAALQSLFKEDVCPPDVLLTLVSIFEVGAEAIWSEELRYRILMHYLNCFSDSCWRRVIESYIQELTQIFKEAPAIEQPMTVYRGERNHSYWDDGASWFTKLLQGVGRHRRGRFLTPLSTSTNLDTAFNFSGDECCMMRLKLRPGVKALYLRSLSQVVDEDEILLAPGTSYELVDETRRVFHTPRGGFSTISSSAPLAERYERLLCDSVKEYKRITTMIVNK